MSPLRLTFISRVCTSACSPSRLLYVVDIELNPRLLRFPLRLPYKCAVCSWPFVKSRARSLCSLFTQEPVSSMGPARTNTARVRSPPVPARPREVSTACKGCISPQFRRHNLVADCSLRDHDAHTRRETVSGSVRALARLNRPTKPVRSFTYRSIHPGSDFQRSFFFFCFTWGHLYGPTGFGTNGIPPRTTCRDSVLSCSPHHRCYVCPVSAMRRSTRPRRLWRCTRR